MGETKAIPVTLNTVLENLSSRLSIVERGIRPNTGLSNEVLKTHVVAAGAEYTAGVLTLSWDDANVKSNPKATPVFEIYVDSDDTAANLYPDGGSLSTALRNFEFIFLQDLIDLTSNPYQNKFVYYIKNNDASQHTYYIHVKMLYLATNSAITLA